jgi:hypothetical protein
MNQKPDAPKEAPKEAPEDMPTDEDYLAALGPCGK